jgi:4-hydroxy-4-methyl-2-oxoglutarate aldolase
MTPPLKADQLAAIGRLDTCTVANAIETFDVRLRNEGFADRGIRRLVPAAAPLVGYAATLRIRCSNPPMTGPTPPDRTDWWNSLLALPAPRVVVIQDMDESPGTGAFIGEVHAAILQALGCVGVVTNGTVRDVPAIEQTGFQLFASGLAVSHAFAHIVDFGHPVEVGGLRVCPGDLLHADVHGVLGVPLELVPGIPPAAGRLMAQEQRVIDLCRSKDFSPEKLRAVVQGIFD